LVRSRQDGVAFLSCQGEGSGRRADSLPRAGSAARAAHRPGRAQARVEHRAGSGQGDDGEAYGGGAHVAVVTGACATRASSASGSFESWAQVTRTARKPEAASTESRRRSASNAAREERNA